MSIGSHPLGENALAEAPVGDGKTHNAPPSRTLVAKADEAAIPEPR